MAGGEDGGQVRRPEPPRLPAAAGRRGPPVAGEDPGGAFPGRARLSGKAGPEARRGHRRRGARRGSAQVVESGEVGGDGRILEPAAIEPGVEPAERPGVLPAGVRGEGGLGEAAGGAGVELEGAAGRARP